MGCSKEVAQVSWEGVGDMGVREVKGELEGCVLGY